MSKSRASASGQFAGTQELQCRPSRGPPRRQQHRGSPWLSCITSSSLLLSDDRCLTSREQPLGVSCRAKQRASDELIADLRAQQRVNFTMETRFGNEGEGGKSFRRGALHD